MPDETPAVDPYPEGTPQSVAIFLSGDGGWNLGVVSMAHALIDMGAVVIGVDIRQYLGALGKGARRENAPCQLIAGDFENLSHQIQKEIGMFVYHVPVLVGYSSGATVVYAALAQSPPGTFAGALSLGFCPDQDFAGAALCPGPGGEPAARPARAWPLQQGNTRASPRASLPLPARAAPSRDETRFTAICCDGRPRVLHHELDCPGAKGSMTTTTVTGTT